MTDLIIQAVTTFVGLLLDTIPAIEPPAWFADVGGFLGLVFGFAGSMGVWFPGALVGSILAGVLGLWVVSFGIKVVRIIISHVTGGGGSAA